MMSYQLGCDYCGRDLNEWFIRIVSQKVEEVLILSPLTLKDEAVFCSVEHLKGYLESNGTSKRN